MLNMGICRSNDLTRIRSEVDSGMQLQIRQVETIARSRSGKHRFVVREFEQQ